MVHFVGAGPGAPDLITQRGAALLRANPQISVDVHNPEITVRVEIREKAAYIHGETKPGAGGEIQLTDAMAVLAERAVQACHRPLRDIFIK